MTRLVVHTGKGRRPFSENTIRAQAASSIEPYRNKKRGEVSSGVLGNCNENIGPINRMASGTAQYKFSFIKRFLSLFSARDAAMIGSFWRYTKRKSFFGLRKNSEALCEWDGN